jgi:hypothetical protein
LIAKKYLGEEKRMIKFEVNEDKIRDVTNENLGYQYPEELIGDKNRLEGMIKNHVMFCSLVTGYRGTGKSSFVRQVLRDIRKNEPDKEKILVINVNATKYTEYTIFIKRFIRELFLEYSNSDKKENIPARLRSLYLHTFFDMRQSMKISHIVNKRNGEKKSKKYVLEKSFSIDYSDLKDIVLFFLGSIALCIIETITINYIAGIVSFIFIILFAFLKGFQINQNKKRLQEAELLLEKENTYQNENDYSVETLFDDEIAEYHLYHEIEEAMKNGRTIVFILDELDKIEDESELRKIFRELKPLFLSNYCDVILIAGKNMDKYLTNEKEESDSVVSSMFSQQIYVPLSTLQDMKEFAYKFLTSDSKVAASSLEKYINQKIIYAKGNKRRFINAILSDITWEGNKAYIYYNDTVSYYDDKIFVILDEMETYLFTNYKMLHRDEALYHIFDWIDEIIEMGLTPFDVENLTKNNQKYKEICCILLDKLKNAKLIIINEESRYILSNAITTEKANTLNDDKFNNFEIERYLQVINTFTKVFSEFGEYNELSNDVSIVLSELKQRKVIDTSEFDRFEKYLADSQGYKDTGYLEFNVDNRNKINDKMYLARSIEILTQWTIKNKSHFSIPFDYMKTDNFRFDLYLCNDNRSSAIVAEIKYYSDILKLIRKDFYALIGRFLLFQKENPSMKYYFYLLFYADSIKKEDRDRLLNIIEELSNNAIFSDINLDIFIVSITNLREDIDAVIKSINSKAILE